MPTPLTPAAHAPSQRLILFALGQSDAELVTHLENCASCRAQVESYQAVLAATRHVLRAGSGQVTLISCQNRCVMEGAEYELGSVDHTIGVALTATEGILHGRLRFDDTCTCWQDAPVRLFGPFGLVASGRVDAQGEFKLPLPRPGQRYSLGLVLTRHGTPELQIIGDFDVDLV